MVMSHCLVSTTEVSAMRCKFCKKEINENTKTCPFCDRKTSQKKMTVLYWAAGGSIVLAIWFFALGGNTVVADWLYSDGFTVDSNFERNIIPLNEMTIEIDPDFNATFVNRVNYYQGLLIGVFDGEIYSQLLGEEVRKINSDNLETYQVIRYIEAGMAFNKMDIAGGTLYYAQPRGHLKRYDFSQTNQDEFIFEAVSTGIFDFQRFDNFVLHRTFTWNFFRHRPNRIADENIYRFDLENGIYEVWIDGGVRGIREFFADEKNDRILFSVGSSIFEVDFNGENKNLITDNFLHYTRNDPHMTFGWMYDGNRVGWIDSQDWTGIQSSAFVFDFETKEETYLGRIPDGAAIGAISNYILISDTRGHLYLVDIDARHRRLLTDDVMRFAVVGDHIFYQQLGTGNIYVMDLDGNVALFNVE